MRLPLDKLLVAGTAGLATLLARVTVTQAVSQPKAAAFDTLECR